MHDSLLGQAALQDRLAALGALLSESHPLWAPRPFVEQPAPWEADHPKLAAWLRALPEARLEAWEAKPELPEDAPPLLRALDQRARALCALPEAPRLAELPPERGVPGRKQAQLRALVPAALPHLVGLTEIVDWCAGKGHLGRALALATGTPVCAVERDAALAASGQALAERQQAPLRFHVADALSPEGAAPLRPGRGAVALHACGALHLTLMERAHAQGAEALVIAPCCYHRVPSGPVHPRSRVGQARAFPMHAELLRLATAEEVVARPTLMRRRRREMALRLGLDQWLRDQGAPGYTNLPPIPRSQAELPLRALAERLLTPKGIPLPASFDADRYAEIGAGRAAVARRLSLVRALFRRPLELFLAMDRAAWLADRGWEVGIGRFCERTLTPRNLLIAARRASRT
ncbi:MAG: methyltransferase [Alphaproteobacteria bacterium]|nr:methyltransferase [Alphaproteobacteria bacterium]